VRAWLDLPALELAALAAIGAYVANAAIKADAAEGDRVPAVRHFLAPAIWLGWLTEASLN
jgi:leader peptidase (prepilin peptidase) / N-methyltransferase